MRQLSVLRLRIPPTAPITTSAPVDRAPLSATHQDATAGDAPKRRICWKLKVEEKTGPPGRVALSECAAYATATCLRILTLVPAPRSRARCIRAYVPIEASSTATAPATQSQRGVRSWVSAPVSADQPKYSSAPRMSSTTPATTGPRRHQAADGSVVARTVGPDVAISL